MADSLRRKRKLADSLIPCGYTPVLYPIFVSFTKFHHKTTFTDKTRKCVCMGAGEGVSSRADRSTICT